MFFVFFFPYLFCLCNIQIDAEYIHIYIFFFRIFYLNRKKPQLFDERYMFTSYLNLIIMFLHTSKEIIILNFIFYRLFMVDFQMKIDEKRKKY